MKVSLDSSFFFAAVKGQLKGDAALEAARRLMRNEDADEYHLSVLAYEEMARLGAESLEDFESPAAKRVADAALFREAAQVIPLDSAAARTMARLWATALQNGQKSGTVDALIARDVVRAGCTLITSDNAQYRYATKAFGEAAAWLVETA